MPLHGNNLWPLAFLVGGSVAKQEGSPRAKTRRLDVTVESQRKAQIIDAARACITAEGVEKLTLRRVAERAQVSHATIAYYFNTRRELIDSALLEISEDFMIGIRQRQLLPGVKDLVELVETFLDPQRPNSRFIVQMVDAGLHDMDLRSTHDEFLNYGRDRIERSIRAGIEMGELRSDIDPAVAAALLHTVLIFWEAELVAGAASRERALEVAGLALRLLDSSNQPLSESRTPPDAFRSVVRGLGTPADVLEASLMDDPLVTPEAARTLAHTFRELYGLVALSGSEPSGSSENP
jgi:AcrR family transcriptional regulator